MIDYMLSFHKDVILYSCYYGEVAIFLLKRRAQNLLICRLLLNLIDDI